jgi:hypothetical protein
MLTERHPSVPWDMSLVSVWQGGSVSETALVLFFSFSCSSFRLMELLPGVTWTTFHPDKSHHF